MELPAPTVLARKISLVVLINRFFFSVLTLLTTSTLIKENTSPAILPSHVTLICSSLLFSVCSQTYMAHAHTHQMTNKKENLNIDV